MLYEKEKEVPLQPLNAKPTTGVATAQDPLGFVSAFFLRYETHVTQHFVNPFAEFEISIVDFTPFLHGGHKLEEKKKSILKSPKPKFKLLCVSLIHIASEPLTVGFQRRHHLLTHLIKETLSYNNNNDQKIKGIQVFRVNKERETVEFQPIYNQLAALFMKEPQKNWKLYEDGVKKTIQIEFLS
jgi:hypothetical protein